VHALHGHYAACRCRHSAVIGYGCKAIEYGRTKRLFEIGPGCRDPSCRTRKCTTAA